MIEIIPDPDFDDAGAWYEFQHNAGTWDIHGGQLVCTGYQGIIKPQPEPPVIAGSEYAYEVEIIDCDTSKLQVIQWGAEIIWVSTPNPLWPNGIGSFTGTVIPTNDETLSISCAFSPSTTLVIERISIMADSIRELCLQSFENQIAAITTANGYDVNVGEVERARQQFELVSDAAVGIFDGSEETTQRHGKNFQNMQVSAQMHSDASSENLSVHANKMIASLKKGILSADVTHSGYAERTYLAGSEIRWPDEDNNTIVQVNATFGIVYKEVVGDPYSTS